MRTLIIICLISIGNSVFGGIKVTGSSSVNPAPHGHFGWSVSIEGNFCVVSAPNESYDSIVSSGAVYLYKIDGGNWKFFQRIIPNDPSVMKLFGSSVKLRGSTMLVGAPNDNGKSGAVYVYTFNGVLWEQSQKITPQNPVPFQMFGTAVDLGFNYALISTVSTQNNEISTGSVYVFQINSSNWTEESVINSPEIGVHDLFGASSAIVSPDQFIVAAPRGNGLVGNSGVLYSFIKQNGNWIKNQKIESPTGREDGLFGSSISCFENRLLVGAMQELVDSVISGAAYFYKLENSNIWNLEQKVYPDILIDHDYFGIEVELNKDIAIIGSPKWESVRENTDMGCADVYGFDQDQWNLTKKISPEDGEKDDHFGMAIAIDKNNLVIGARLDDNLSFNDGSAHFYNLSDLQTKIPEIHVSENAGIQRIFPNPFKQETTIAYVLTEKTRVKIEVFNMAGAKIIQLINREETAGFREVIWNRKDVNGRNVVSGIYICKFEAGHFIQSKQMVVY